MPKAAATTVGALVVVFGAIGAGEAGLVDTIVTDWTLDPSRVAEIERRGIRVIVASEPATPGDEAS